MVSLSAPTSGMTLDYNDDLTGTAILVAGIVRNDDGTLWSIEYVLSGLIAAEDGGFKATAGPALNCVLFRRSVHESLYHS